MTIHTLQHAFHYGKNAILIDNATFAAHGLPPEHNLTCLKINQLILSTIGYTTEAINKLLETDILHIEVSPEGYTEDYEPYIMLGLHGRQIQTMRRLEDEITRIYQSPSDIIQGIAISFSRKYKITMGQQKTFVAHMSPIIVGKIQEEKFLFVFDHTGNNLVNKKEGRTKYVIDGLLHSSANCNAFTLAILHKLIKYPDLIQFMREKNSAEGGEVTIPLKSGKFPSALMKYCESVSQQEKFGEDTPVSTLLGKLVTIDGETIQESQEKKFSVALYKKNIKNALKCNWDNPSILERLNVEFTYLKQEKA